MQAANTTASATQNAARPEVTEARLTDFEKGATSLTLDHMLTLDRWIVPIINAGGSVTVMGIDSVGELIAVKRANVVMEYLNSMVKGVSAKTGTLYSRSQLDLSSSPQVDTLTKMADSEDPLYRAVQVAAWMGSTPPTISRPNPGAHPKVVQRLIRASRTTKNHREIGGENSPGIAAMKIGGDAATSVISKRLKEPGFRPKYEYSNVLQNHTINEIIYSTLSKQITFAGETVTYDTKIIEYVYGEPSKSVAYTKRYAYYYGDISNSRLVEMTPEKAKWTVEGRKLILRKDVQKEIGSLDF